VEFHAEGVEAVFSPFEARPQLVVVSLEQLYIRAYRHGECAESQKGRQCEFFDIIVLVVGLSSVRLPVGELAVCRD